MPTFTKESLITGIKKYALSVLFTLGIATILVYYAFKLFSHQFFESHQIAFRELFGFGLTIIGSGIFLAVLKWFQFMGFFKEEMHDIIASSEFDERLHSSIYNVVYSDDFLSKRSDLDFLWKKVNRALFKNQFPDEFAEKIEEKMHNVFFHNSNLSHYYKNFIQTVDITLGHDDFVTVNITIEAKIVRSSTDKFNYNVGYFVEKVDKTDTLTTITYNKIIIDKKDMDLSKSIFVQEEGLNVSKELKLELEGKKEYVFFSDITMVYKMTGDDDEYQLSA